MPAGLHRLGGKKDSPWLKSVAIPSPMGAPWKSEYCLFNFLFGIFVFYFCILFLYFLLLEQGWKKTNALYRWQLSRKKPWGAEKTKCVQYFGLPHLAPTHRGWLIGVLKQAALLSNGFSRIWLPLSRADVNLQYWSESLYCAPWRWCAPIVNNPPGTRRGVTVSRFYRLAATNGKLSAEVTTWCTDLGLKEGGKQSLSPLIN